MPRTPPASIAILPELVKNQIAAGEVIERPASVVKELVENALDAGANRIEIELEQGGVKLVRVSDDGRGMSRADLELAFVGHATSKLASVDDLDHIATLGFRGEALASIGSVARCQLTSRRLASELGWTVTNEGGRVSRVVEAGGPLGTAAQVRDLFFNTPARRRFLKTTSTELGRSLDVIQRLALANEGVGFVVLHDGRRALDVEASMDLVARVRRLFGAELAEQLVAVDGTLGTTRLYGYVAPPRFARRDTQRQMWFLNGRPLRDKILLRTLKDAYRGFLADGRQPVAFLHLAMDPAAVDVNVHPAKAEVRFREQRQMFAFLVHHLREAVAKTDMATPGERLLESAGRRGDWREAPRPAANQAAFDPGVLRPRPAPEPVVVRDVPGQPYARPPAAQAEAVLGPFLKVARTYVIRATEDGFEIVDQHALHERVTYEELKRDLRAGALEVQRLLLPEVIELGRDRVKLVEEHLDSLAGIGIALSIFGESAVAVQGVPARLRHDDCEGLVRDAVEVIASRGRAPQAEELLEELLHSRACRSSVMAGDDLSHEEIASLLRRASRVESDQTCPHGRPTRVRFTLADLEKAFHRR